MKREHVVELYDRYIAYIRHENELFHQRTTWFLAVQTGLAALLAYTATYLNWPFVFLDPDPKITAARLIASFLLISAIATFGVYTAVRAGPPLQAARRAQHKIERQWKKRFRAEADKIGLPRLMGGGSRSASRLGGKLATRLPGILRAAWACLIVASVLLATFRWGQFYG